MSSMQLKKTMEERVGVGEVLGVTTSSPETELKTIN